MKYYLKVVFSWICGVEHRPESDTHIANIPFIPSSFEDDSFWKRICNINGIVLTAFCAFIFAFFTDYRIDKLYRNS